MYPINDLQGIRNQESQLEGNHVVILMLVKPSDTGADEYIKQFNYLHYRSKQYCSWYALSRVFKKFFRFVQTLLHNHSK